MKHCCEYLRGLCYKLHVMDIPCDGPSYNYDDNQSVLANATNPYSTLKKKSNIFLYHFVNKGSTRDEWRKTYSNTHENTSDLLTKQLPKGKEKNGFVCMILYQIFGIVK